MTSAEQITKASKSNLALAFFVLSKERQRDISVFYAFCRIVDDIADGESAPHEKAAALQTWRRALVAEVPGEPALAQAQREIIEKYKLNVAHFHEIITGVEADILGARYETWEDLRLYCHRVASVVGLVSIQIFGATDPAADSYARNLGLALQITNILRDVGEDFANGGRIYLPEEDLRRFGVSHDDIAHGRRTREFLALMDFTADRAEAFYQAAIRPGVDRLALRPSEIMRSVYHTLLGKMRADRWQVFGNRYRLGRFRKMWAVLRGILK